MAKKVTLDWTDPSPTTYVNQLEIWRKLDGGTYAHIGGAQLGDETYDDESGVTDGSKYYYEVRAYNIDREYSVVENNITISEFLLDLYTGAEAAYSLRKLKTGINYAIEIRRDNDDATTGVQVYSNGDSIDLSSIVSDGGVSLGTWVGSNSAYIKTWYDQSGNSNDLLQVTGAYQPNLINAGALRTENGLSTVFNDDDNVFMYKAFTLSDTVDTLVPTIAIVTQSDNATTSTNGLNSTSVGLFPGTSAADRRKIGVVTEDSSQYSIRLDGGNTVWGSASGLSQHLAFITKPLPNTTFTLRYNGSSKSVASSGGTKTLNLQSDSGFTMFKYPVGGSTYSSQDNGGYYGNIQEAIWWFEDKTSNASAIETEINNHYSIY